MSLRGQIFRSRKTTQSNCHVFISHRRIDTNKNVAGLLYDHFSRLNLRPFLDNKSMKPGDKLFKKIDAAIRDCKVGIAVLSPNYCDSYFCLHELYMMIIECRKKVIPIFVDVKPSELRVLDNGRCPTTELFRFREAIEEAKNTVGLTFDSSNGDWSNLVKKASDGVMKNLLEVEGETLGQKQTFVIEFLDMEFSYLDVGIRWFWIFGKSFPIGNWRPRFTRGHPVVTWMYYMTKEGLLAPKKSHTYPTTTTTTASYTLLLIPPPPHLMKYYYHYPELRGGDWLWERLGYKGGIVLVSQLGTACLCHNPVKLLFIPSVVADRRTG
ncbi:probable 2' cyclic ADP-D-ribose synthase BdTIR [Rhododendron vialii]|uniref:probable 2' cyclic ADP-D-ribose synthase BdTIR n=1 Tax=Rhododendron vialii TaxID=182163 RepID=UPI00265D9A2C|nr:probable 2' cyclic ADP-D-ribose synthase BdTIR [Rhododendron vialii]